MKTTTLALFKENPTRRPATKRGFLRLFAPFRGSAVFETTLLAVLLTAPLSSLGQGKVNFVNDAASLIVLPTDTSQLMAADAALAGQPVGNQVLLPSGKTLVAGLYGGTSSSHLYLYSSVVLNDAAMPAGYIPPMHVVLNANPATGAPAIPGIANGTPITATTPWFQVKVWDAAFASFEAALGQGYAGQGAPFQLNPGPSLPYVNTAPAGVNSTWTDSVFILGGWGPPCTPCQPCSPCGISIWSAPTNQTVIQNSSVVFSVVASSPYPLGYQWYFNGAPMAALSSSYVISSVQPTNAGTYFVRLNNGFRSLDSSPATLVVLVPPHLTASPLSQTAESGDTVGFSASATGDRPLMYQWFFNDTTAVSGATTNNGLQLANVQNSQAGAYTVVVTNTAGAVTSPPAMLAVIAPVPRRLVPALTLMGQTGSALNLDYAASAQLPPNWTTLDTVALTNPAQWYFDVTDPLPAQRFYRAWSPNSPGPRPTLDLHLLPALELAGPVGSHWRIDYINRFGSIYNWSNLANITLTNTSQLFFDTSVIGQPPRLWRLVPVP